MRKYFTRRLLFVPLCLCALCCFSLSVFSAEPKDPKNNFGKLLVLKGESSARTACLMDFKGKKYVVSSMDAVYESRTSKVVDAESKEIKTGKLYTLDDGREIAFFDVEGEKDRPSLDISEKTDSEQNANSKIYGYGLTSAANAGTFVSSQGKLNGISAESIAVSLKMRKNEDLAGGPIVSDKTGRAIGVIRVTSENDYSGIRLDLPGNLVEINDADYALEAKRMHRIEDDFNSYSQKLKEFPKQIKETIDRVRKEKTAAGNDKNTIMNTYAGLSRDFGTDYQALKELSGKSKIAFFNRKCADLLKVGAKINDDLASVKKDVDELDRKFGESFEKQKMREVNKIK